MMLKFFVGRKHLNTSFFLSREQAGRNGGMSSHWSPRAIRWWRKRLKNFYCCNPLSIGCKGRIQIEMTFPNLICFPCPNTIIKEHKIVRKLIPGIFFTCEFWVDLSISTTAKRHLLTPSWDIKCNFHFFRSSDVMALVYPPSHVGFHRRNSTVANIFAGLRIREIIAFKLHSVSFPMALRLKRSSVLW